MKVIEIVKRAQACRAGLPVPTAGERTLEAYWRTFQRMLAEPVLDPLRAGDARDTYNHRRAALHAGSWRMLDELIGGLLRAAESSDVPVVREHARALVDLLDRLEPVLALEPPLAPGQLATGAPPSRWAMQEGDKPRRGKAAKKHILRELPRDWLDRLWEAAAPDWPWRAALAVAILVPCRPAELAPQEASDPCGIEIALAPQARLRIRVFPAKSHGGRYGSGSHAVILDPALAGPAAVYLLELCRQAPTAGRPVEVAGSNIFRKALLRLGAQALSDVEAAITPYLIRAQVIADMKATLGAGAEVAILSGHCTDRTQARYGHVVHGRRRGGIVAVRAARTPRTGHVARAVTLSESRRRPGPGAAP